MAPVVLVPRTTPDAAEAAFETIELNCDDSDSVRRNVSRRRLSDDIDGDCDIILIESSFSWRNKRSRADIFLVGCKQNNFFLKDKKFNFSSNI